MGPLISQRNNARSGYSRETVYGFNGAADFSAEQHASTKETNPCVACFNGAADFSAEQLVMPPQIHGRKVASMGPLISQRNNVQPSAAANGLCGFNGAADFSAEQLKLHNGARTQTGGFNGAADFSAEQRHPERVAEDVQPASMGPLISQRNNVARDLALVQPPGASMGPLISQRNNWLPEAP